MKINFSSRIFGSFFVLAGIIGFLTVADDLRHVGEFVGVASITFSGLILLAGSLEHRLSRLLPARWMALGTLSGIIVGAMLDTMVLGVAIGITAGTLIGYALLPTHRMGNGKVPGE